ncbi:MAG: hypothetical protein AB8F34_00980 [Akkermansiaceae bacterium]
MNLNKILKIGLLSAFSLSSLLFTSCDAVDTTTTTVSSDDGDTGGGGGDTGTDIFPDLLNDGDMITITGIGTITIVSSTTATYSDVDGNFVDAPVTFTFREIGTSRILDIKFDGFAEGEAAIAILNVLLEDATSDFAVAQAALSDPASETELDALIEAGSDGSTVTIDYDTQLGLYIAETLTLIIPNSGTGAVNISTSGSGFTIAADSPPALDGSTRRQFLPEGAGAVYIPAPAL